MSSFDRSSCKRNLIGPGQGRWFVLTPLPLLFALLVSKVHSGMAILFSRWPRSMLITRNKELLLKCVARVPDAG